MYIWIATVLRALNLVRNLAMNLYMYSWFKYLHQTLTQEVFRRTLKWWIYVASYLVGHFYGTFANSITHIIYNNLELPRG